LLGNKKRHRDADVPLFAMLSPAYIQFIVH
jgi:hypothetical protein